MGVLSKDISADVLNGLLIETAKGVMLFVKVLPNASKNEVSDIQGDYLRVKIAAAPVKGKANKECQELLAGFFKVKRSQILIVKGEASRQKQVLIEGLSKREVLERLKADD